MQQHARPLSGPFNRHPLATAALWALGVAASPAHADISATGVYGTYPDFFLVGPGDTDIGSSTLGVGSGGVGSFSVTAGSQFNAASIRFADGGNGVGTGVFDGVGTKVSISGNGNTNRLELGAWGRGALTVSGGATLDGRANADACLLGPQWCNNFIGNAAGSDALFTVTGAGSNASFLRGFVVGGLAVFGPPIENFTFGTPGGTTRARVEVLNGGTLTTDGASIGVAPGGSSLLGTERSIAEVAIDGSNSVWSVTGGTLENTGAAFSTANHRNAVATLTVSNGGKLHIDGRDGMFNSVGLTTNGGRTDMLVTGAGSSIAFTGDAGVLQVGRRLGSALLTLQDGAAVTGVWYTAVGRDGSFGEMVVNGAGTVYSSTGLASAAAAGSFQNPVLDIGRNGSGVVTVSNGGRLELLATEARINGPEMSLGRDAASAGTLNITGPGSVVQLSAQSVVPGGGAGEAFNPFMRVGRDGSGTLNITGGGKLLIDGQAVSTVAAGRSTSLFIGGAGEAVNGGKGIALVSGLGSEIRMTGSDTYIGVGHGPQSNGQLTVADRASVSSIGMIVGRSGGVGVLKVDNATLNLSGQQTGNNQTGAFMVLGHAGGIGVGTITNNSVVTIANMGTGGASLSLGGTTPGPLGEGSLTLSGGSQIRIQAAPGLASMVVARDGSALMRVKGASTVDVGDGSLYIARLKGSDGTMIVTEGSTIKAGWVGVGRNRIAGGDTDGGTGTMVLTGSVLDATTIVIGTNGFLGGSGTINGAVTNYGIFSPGNSPGRMDINGAYLNGGGSRLILEVEADGLGGFITDEVVFGQGTTVDLASLSVDFRFLGTADPNAFQASGLFDIDNFVKRSNGSGGFDALDASAFSSVSFTAQSQAFDITGFTYTVAGGANFTATPVPEPQTWALLMAGLVCVGWMARRREQRAG